MNEKMLHINDVYNGFTVLDISPILDYKSEGIWLRHNETGLEIFHMYNDDSENLFSFAFKTIPSDSTGLAHIMEHSVLCGSKNYPLKDPFIRMANQSVKTFLNAMTFPDKTVYPASSTVEADYFNLMAVYADAVFFPLLKKEIFMQEAHRLALGEDGAVSIQGVVFNEMMGNYSSFDSMVQEKIVQTILPGTTYAFDSGGDPREIPLLSYERFLDFHKTFYQPSNCRLFLYGNIPTTKQIDFLNEKVLSQFKTATNPFSQMFLSKQDSDFCAQTQVRAFTAPQNHVCYGPSVKGAGSENGDSLLLTWLLGFTSDPQSYMESLFLAELLLGHDGAPLAKALIESGLGEDLEPASGIETDLRYILFTAGMRGVKKNKEEEIEALILETIEKLIRDGIPQDEIEAALMSVDFADREIKRVNGPFSIVLMRRCLRGWLNESHPAKTLQNRSTFAAIKKRIYEDDSYLAKLLEKYFIKNQHRVRLIMKSSPDFEKEIQEKVALETKRLFENYVELYVEKKGISKTETQSIKEIDEKIRSIIQKENEDLASFQEAEEDDSLLSLLPHLKPKDLDPSIDIIETKRREIQNIPTFLHEQEVNGILYFTLGFPCDLLEAKDYLLLPFFCMAASNSGFDSLDWAEASSKLAQATGGFSASPLSSPIDEELKRSLGIVDENGKTILLEEDATERLYKADPSLGRSWIFFKMKTLEEKSLKALELVFSCIKNVDFSDKKRIEDLLIEYKNGLVSSIIPGGTAYAVSRANCFFSRETAIDEIWSGLTQIAFIKELSKKSIDEVIQSLLNIKKQLLESGAIINIIAEKQSMPRLISEVEKGMQDFFPEVQAPKKPRLQKDEAFFDLIRFLPDTDDKTEVFILPTQVGFAASCFSMRGDEKEQVAISVLAHYLTNTAFWAQIRTMGGAYGAQAFYNTLEAVFLCASFRDPNPERSLRVFIDECKKLSSLSFDTNLIEKLITGSYSKEIQPKTPSIKGSLGFIRSLYGINDEKRQRRMQYLLEMDEETLKKVSKDIAHSLFDMYSAVINQKALSKTGKNIHFDV